jgi:predicted dehydrogenase
VDDQQPADPVRLLTCDPGHFHAALVQKEMLPGVAARCHVYAPLGPDLLAHLARLADFNARSTRPGSWEVEVHAGPDPLQRLLAEKPGNVVILSGRNRGRIHTIRAALRAGLHVLADKPWVLDPTDLPILDEALDLAERRNLIALAIMTERYEVTTLIQRELCQDPGILGVLEPGTPEQPAVFLASVHQLRKEVAGKPLLRPAWFFDPNETGEGLNDVGTHLVDLVPWMLHPGQVIQPDDVALLTAKRWPTRLSRSDFQAITGESTWPSFLANLIREDSLAWPGNTSLSWSLRGVHIGLDVRWDLTTPGGSETHQARVQGSRACIEVRQGPAEGFRQELFVFPRHPDLAEKLRPALHYRIERLQTAHPGLRLAEHTPGWWIVIPEPLRVGHEAHFAQVFSRFLDLVQRRAEQPAWENALLRLVYHVTTRGVQLARQSDQ